MQRLEFDVLFLPCFFFSLFIETGSPFEPRALQPSILTSYFTLAILALPFECCNHWWLPCQLFYEFWESKLWSSYFCDKCMIHQITSLALLYGFKMVFHHVSVIEIVSQQLPSPFFFLTHIHQASNVKLHGYETCGR